MNRASKLSPKPSASGCQFGPPQYSEKWQCRDENRWTYGATDASVILRLGYQALRRAGLSTEQILTKAGVAISQLETNQRTPVSAQSAFWLAAEQVSHDPDIGLHLGEHLPLYRGPGLNICL